MRVNTFLAAAIAIGVAACSPILSRVNLRGGTNDLNAIAGEWGGEYHSPELGRSGSIVFRFSPETNAAFGDVAMGRSAQNSNIDAMKSSLPVTSGDQSQILTIRFVSVVNGDLFGVLAPYSDPSCDCLVRTTFNGHLDDATTIRGTFATTSSQSATAKTGTWKVTRR